MQNPRDSHDQAALHVPRYLKGSSWHGLFYSTQSDFKLSAFSDSDWASCPTTFSSTAGFFITLGDSPISWRTKKQAVVSRSFAEVEYCAMALTTCELVCLKSLLRDFVVSHPQRILLYCDNEAALPITSNLVFHECTKHIKIDRHFMHENIMYGLIIPTYVSSKHQLADIFTKALGKDLFLHFNRKLGIMDLHAPTWNRDIISLDKYIVYILF